MGKNNRKVLSMLEGAMAVSRALNKITVKPKMSLKEVDGQVKLALPGFLSGPKEEYRFPGFSCVSKAQVVCHGIPQKDRWIDEEDVIKVDVATKKSLRHGYSDMCWSFLIGKKNHSLWLRSYLCTWFIVRSLAWVSKINELVTVSKYYSKKFSLTIVKEFGGHFIGKKMHEGDSFIPYYDYGKVNLSLLNRCFTIEPIYTDSKDYSKFLINERMEHSSKRKGDIFIMFEHTVYLTERKYYVLSYNMKRGWCKRNGLPYLDFSNYRLS